MSVDRKLIEWFLNGDTGVSSMAIAAHLTGIITNREFSDYPSDGSDFGRCYELLKRIPEFAPRIGEMATRSPQWAALVAHWDELTAIYEREDMAIYKRMKAILAAAPDENRIYLGNGISMKFQKARREK